MKEIPPAISVVIPMYNAEEYIGECLDSLLEQTFQDFEVIVVDDCSTDESVSVVESYVPKFDGRLQLAHTEVNSGGGGYVPRNIGLSLAQGKYVHFTDADDFLLLTALETLYNAAEEYEADVVYTSARYLLAQPNEISKSIDPQARKLVKENLEDKLTLTVDNPEENLNSLFKRGNFLAGWTKFIRRDLLVENEIIFPDIKTGGDYIWGVHLYCCAKRFLRLPVPIYFYRDYNTESVTKKQRESSEQICHWVSAFAIWAKTFYQLVNKTDVLKNNPAYCHKALELQFKWTLSRVSEDIKGFYSHDIYSLLCSEFAKDNDLANLNLAFLFSVIVNREKAISKLKLRAEKELPAPQIIKFPAVSIVIPFYNAEKFIGECLESLLEQTFQNFEVIVADDCSTDNSVKVVKSYMPKFEGRLLLTKTEQNSGSGSAPRNKGFTFARGEYVFFMDSDDALIKTGLEEMYSLAKKFDADVVYCEKYYMSDGIGEEFKKNAKIAKTRIQHPPFVKEPTLETSKLSKRIGKALKFNYWLTPWLKFIRRNLLVENNITFPLVAYSEDATWTFEVLFCAKTFLRVPNAVYIRRMRDDSVSFRKRTTAEHFFKWMDRTIHALKEIDDFMGKIEFFKRYPSYRFDILDFFLENDFKKIYKEGKNLSRFEFYNIFLQLFGDYLGKHDVLVSLLCTRINTQQKLLEDRIGKHGSLSIINSLQNIKKGALMSYPQQFIRPSVSVIIPMYNAENYIGTCLDSILMQTFQNFEVIIVDDCSTDKSVAIVESYAPKFDGRLQLAKTKTNSGGGGYIPRNIGLNLSHGEYVYFVDADDFIMLNALETLYTAAKEQEADVVYMSAYFDLTKPQEIQAIKDDTHLSGENSENASTLTVEDPNKNLHSLLFKETMPASWRKFLRRDFLIENEILFPEVLNGGDFIWSINVYCHAKRFLRIPSPLYFYRSYNVDSVLRKQRDKKEQISYWVSSFVAWAKSLNELSNGIEILKENPTYCYRALTLKFQWCNGHISSDIKDLYATDIYGILYNEFAQENNAANLITSFFFTGSIVQLRFLLKFKNRIAELENEIQRLKSGEQ